MAQPMISGRELLELSKSERRQIYEEIAEAGGWDVDGTTGGELDHLPQAMAPDELLLSLASGYMDGNFWLIALTDRRVLFLDKRLLYGMEQHFIDLDKINAVSGETGWLFGSIQIQDGGTARVINNVRKKAVNPFVNKVSDALELRARRRMAPPGQALAGRVNPQDAAADEWAESLEGGSAASARLIDDLERLAALRERGVISEAEFAAAKAQLLADWR